MARKAGGQQDIRDAPDAPTYWLSEEDRGSFPPPRSLPTEADVVVIGGGLMGVAVTYWLSRLGVNVALLETRWLTSGATSRNAGLMLAGAASLEDPRVTQSVLDEEGFTAGYAEVGHLALASSTAVWDKVRQEVAARAATASPLYALDRRECEELLGMRIGARFIGGRWLPQGRTVHPVRLALGLAAAARRRGALIATQTRALAVRPLAGLAGFEIATARGVMRARHVVYACQSRIVEFLPQFRSVMTPVHGQMMATEPLPRLFRCGLAVDWGTAYWRQAPDGAVILGGLRDADEVDSSEPDAVVNWRVQAKLDRFLPETFPDFPAFRVRQRWAGIMDCTADARPLIGAVPNTVNQWILAGFGGHGMPGGVGAGKAVAAAIVSGQRDAVLAPFDPSRFTKETGR
jgi:glycine/D-amino acid oxidase-like deaminating enzyme